MWKLLTLLTHEPLTKDSEAAAAGLTGQRQVGVKADTAPINNSHRGRRACVAEAGRTRDSESELLALAFWRNVNLR